MMDQVVLKTNAGEVVLQAEEPDEWSEVLLLYWWSGVVDEGWGGEDFGVSVGWYPDRLAYEEIEYLAEMVESVLERHEEIIEAIWSRYCGERGYSDNMDPARFGKLLSRPGMLLSSDIYHSEGYGAWLHVYSAWQPDQYISVRLRSDGTLKVKLDDYDLDLDELLG